MCSQWSSKQRIRLNLPISAFCPHFSVLSPLQRFILISAFYPHFSVLSPLLRKNRGANSISIISMIHSHQLSSTFINFDYLSSTVMNSLQLSSTLIISHPHLTSFDRALHIHFLLFQKRIIKDESGTRLGKWLL